MSTPMPSPSMNGMIGLSGTGCPGTILAPSAGTVMSDVVVIGVLLARFARRVVLAESYRHSVVGVAALTTLRAW